MNLNWGSGIYSSSIGRQKVIHTKYGPPEVVKLIDVDKPIPKDNEVLINVYALQKIKQ